MKPVVGGILILIGAIAGLASGAMIMMGGGMLMPFDMGSGLGAFCMAVGAIYVILSIIALIGAIFAIQRKHFGIAILGGIFALLFGYFIFGLIGLILVAISRKEFS